MATTHARADAQFAQGLARAFAGAVIFGLPLLMTMEMWWLAFTMQPTRLAVLVALFLPLLVALSWHVGFEPTFDWKEDILDALVAFAVGTATAVVVLSLLGALTTEMGPREWVGKVSLQAVPGSIGALLAQSTLGEAGAGSDVRGGRTTYFSELFIMAIGALFLAFNVAPTEEVLLIALQMSEAQALVLALASLAVMHAFVYSVAFRGRPQEHGQAPWWSLLARFTVVGYAIALLLAGFLLWAFGRLDGLLRGATARMVVVLGFPASVGAAASRLML